MKKRFVIWICICCMLLAGIPMLAGGFADGEHPITMTVTCDPDPELEEGGTVPDLLFTIRNNGSEDYTLKNATLSGGYEGRSLALDETITVLAGGTKEFHLNDVAVSDEQLDEEITYKLSWEESETKTDPDTGELLTVKKDRETTAAITIARFVLPELTVSVMSSAEKVRVGETFTVTYTIANDTKFDMSSLKLYDPEQSMQRIELPSTNLYSGETCSIEITYTMDKKDMTFKPSVEYIARQRQMLSQPPEALTVGSVAVELKISVQQYPTTKDGAVFAITVQNTGNSTVTGICLFDEINTQIGEPFDLPVDQSKVLEFTVPSAVSSGVIRDVRFHVRAVDCFGTTFTVTDSESYQAKPYVGEDEVKLYLYVELIRAYYDDNGKLCGQIQFEIRNYSEVILHDAALTEDILFGELITYAELQNGETYYTEEYQLDGIDRLAYYVTAYDPAGNEYKTGTVQLDLSNLKSLVDQKKDEPVYVYPYNPFFKNLVNKLKKPAMIAAIVVAAVVFVCLVTCIVLFAVERKLKAKLPPAFEEDMEKAMRQTKRRIDNNPVFKDAPTEQFGYRAPIKLRDYGELTEQEAEKRRQEYAHKLRENLDRDAKAADGKQTRKPQAQQQIPQTRIIPVTRIDEKERNAKAQKPRAAESRQTQQQKTIGQSDSPIEAKRPERGELLKKAYALTSSEPQTAQNTPTEQTDRTASKNPSKPQSKRPNGTPAPAADKRAAVVTPTEPGKAKNTEPVGKTEAAAVETPVKEPVQKIDTHTVEAEAAAVAASAVIAAETVETPVKEPVQKIDTHTVEAEAAAVAASAVITDETFESPVETPVEKMIDEVKETSAETEAAEMVPEETAETETVSDMPNEAFAPKPVVPVVMQEATEPEGSTEEAQEEPAEGSTEEAPEEPTEGSTEEAPEEPAEGSTEEAPEEPAEGSTEEAPEELPEESTEEAQEEPSEELTEEAPEEPAADIPEVVPVVALPAETPTVQASDEEEPAETVEESPEADEQLTETAEEPTETTEESVQTVEQTAAAAAADAPEEGAPFVRPQHPRFIALQFAQEPAEQTAEPEPEAAYKPRLPFTPAASNGPRSMETVRKPSRRAAERLTVRHMNG